jgi:hypothetical protein
MAMAEDKPNRREIDPLVLHSVYPDAAAIFSFQPSPLQTILSDCLIVLDTNVLLIPYGTGRESLEQVRITYSTLTKQKRLVVPGQVAREFAQNRSEKLKTVFRQVSLKRNISLKRESYPLLESVPEYQELVKQERQLDSQLREYRDSVGSLLDAISSWYWNDPVSTLYRELFSTDVVHEQEINDDALLKDLERRQINKIPPGYKDAAKDDGGIGDLVIWNTILDLGKSRGSHVVFVSGDEKADWWHHSDNKPLFPRFELVDEFRRISSGKSFYIISFAKLLELFGASSEVVQEVREEEAAVNLEGTSRALNTAIMVRALKAEQAVFLWLTRAYPMAQIRASSDSGFDFIVHSATGTIAIKVRYVQRVRGDLRFYEHRLSYMLQGHLLDLARAYMIFVGDDEEVLIKMAQMILRWPLSPRVGRIVGIVDDEGAFREIARQESTEEADIAT